ncbi:MAG: hypothetical protein OEV42_11385 [Deltaproteobacteria bacterium]|nr:hypothetical protein [Deltaproteobacteria bacterium]
MRSRTIIITLMFFLPFFPAGKANALTLHGFMEGAYGTRFEDDLTKKDHYTLGEGRFQIKGSYVPSFLDNWDGEFSFKGDIYYDGYEETTYGDARVAVLSITPHDMIDLKLGRQILTWGTGDLVFINDLFPKDYISFFTGRDDEYLKLPSDAIRGSLFLDMFNVDLVLIPDFEPNNNIKGDRLSYYHGLEGRIVGDDVENDYKEPENKSKNREATLRLYKNIKGMEAALYLFDGFYKDPLGVLKPTPTYQFYYPELTVYGLSLRDAVFGGIGNVEAGYYYSREDKDGDNPMVENSCFKALAGYSKDMGRDFRIGIQYQLEKMLHYDEYEKNLPAGSVKADENRHLWTLRLTKLAMNQNLTLSLFSFYSPSDKDYHLRPQVSYKFTDNLSTTLGGNVFKGEDDHTFFGQLDRNDNAYIRVRYGF